MPTVRSFTFRSEDLKGIIKSIFWFHGKNKKVPTNTEEMETNVNSGSDIESETNDGKDFIQSEPNSNTIESDVNDESFNGK